MRNNAGHGAVAIAVLIASDHCPRLPHDPANQQLNGQKRGLGLVVSRRSPPLDPHEETDPFSYFISGCVCQPVRGRADDFAASTTQSAHDFSFTSIDGENLPLASLKAKPC